MLQRVAQLLAPLSTPPAVLQKKEAFATDSNQHFFQLAGPPRDAVPIVSPRSPATHTLIAFPGAVLRSAVLKVTVVKTFFPIENQAASERCILNSPQLESEHQLDLFVWEAKKQTGNFSLLH